MTNDAETRLGETANLIQTGPVTRPRSFRKGKRMDCSKTNKGLETLKLCLQIAILIIALAAMVEGRTERIRAASERLSILNLVAQANPDNEIIQAVYASETEKQGEKDSDNTPSGQKENGSEAGDEAQERIVVPDLEVYL